MKIANFVDHTLLKPDLTLHDVTRLCNEAKQYQFKAVCIPPYYVRAAKRQLEGSDVSIATVIGFPLGYSSLPSKIDEIRRAIEQGADEFDTVINICAVKDRDWNYIKNEINSLCMAAQLRGKKIKMILETGLLEEFELLKLCEICNGAKVNYVKNATGFNAMGASVETIQFLRANLDKTIKVKAAGGIRTPEFARSLIEAGADRLGSSSSINLL